MYERIGTSLTILSRSPDTFEVEVFVKAEGLRVLLVHIDRQVWMRGEDIAYEGFSNAFAVMVGGDEKRFQMPMMQEHETERRIGTIDGKKQRNLRKEF